MFDIANTGADIKALRFSYKHHNKTNIRISGDPDKTHVATVEDMSGQGTNLSPKGTGLSVGRSTHEAIDPEDCDTIGEVTVDPSEFVDDVLVTNKDTDTARRNSEKVACAMLVLSLETNEAKSSVLVTGGDNLVTRETHAKMRSNKTMVLEKDVECKVQDMYLGFVMHEQGFKQSRRVQTMSNPRILL